jgi:hypothetical protein
VRNLFLKALTLDGVQKFCFHYFSPCKIVSNHVWSISYPKQNGSITVFIHKTSIFSKIAVLTERKWIEIQLIVTFDLPRICGIIFFHFVKG